MTETQPPADMTIEVFADVIGEFLMLGGGSRFGVGDRLSLRLAHRRSGAEREQWPALHSFDIAGVVYEVVAVARSHLARMSIYKITQFYILGNECTFAFTQRFRV